MILQAWKKIEELNCSPKKRFDAAQNIDHRLTFEEVAAAMHEVCTENESIIFTAEFKEESQDKHPEVDKTNIMTLSDFLSASTTQEEFCFKMEYFPEHLAEIERQTLGQSSNLFAVRRNMITASKAHDVKTRMVTLKKGEVVGR